MPKIFFARNQYPPVVVDEGANLRAALLAHGIPVGSSCGGEGVCTKCLLTIASGGKNLSAPNEREQALRQQHGFSESLRVSCQTRVLGDVTVDANYW